MNNEPTPSPQPESFDPCFNPVEEQKTRLWAMSFESANQLVNCTNCGAITTIPRLVANPDTVPERRRQHESDVQSDTGWQRHFEHAQPPLPASREERKKPFKIDDKTAVKALSFISASLLVTLVAVVLKKNKS